MAKYGEYADPGQGVGVAAIMLRKLREFSANDEARVEDLMTPEFMQAHTDLADFDAFVASLVGMAETGETPEGVLDSCVVEHSHFGNYAEMLQAALGDCRKGQ